MTNSLRWKILPIAVITGVLFQSGCGTYELESFWRIHEITVDGRSRDWQESLYYFEDENVSVGIQNDGDALYLCLISEDRSLPMQALSRGMILWFDAKGGKDKSFGIRYPLGNPDHSRPGGRMGTPEDMEERRERIQEMRELSRSELEILGADEEVVRRIKVEEIPGIEIALESTTGIFVYELKLPLKQSENTPYAVEAGTGSLIGIGLEIPKMQMRGMRGGRGGGLPGGGIGGRGGMGGMGGRGGMGGGMRSGARPGMQNGLKVWISAALARENAMSFHR